MTDADTPAAAGSGAGRLVIGAALFLSALVVILVATFPLGVAFDYPNHLAQYHIEANFRDSDIEKSYTLKLGLVPNLAADILVVPLSSIVGVYAAGAVAIALAMLVPALSGMWLRYLLCDKRLSWFSLFVFVPMFNFSLYYGFLNYSLAAGFAILLFAGWIALRARAATRSIIFMIVSPLLFFSHVFGLLLLVYMVALYEIGLAVTRHGVRKATLTGLFRQFTPFIPAIILLMLLFIVNDGANPEREFSIRLPLWSLMSAFAIPNLLFLQDPMHRFLAVIPFALCVLFFYTSFREKLVYVDYDKFPLVIGMFLLAFFAPYQMINISFLDMRFAAPFLITLVACTNISSETIRFRSMGISILVAIILIQFVSGTLAMQKTHEEAEKAKILFGSIRPSANLLTVINADAVAQPYGHFYGYAVVERDVFAPTIFTNSSIIKITEEKSHISFDDWPIDEEALAVGAGKSSPSPGSPSSPIYFFGWEDNFDYVFHVKGEAGKPLSYSCLALIKESERFALYEVDKTDADDPCRQL